MRPDWIEDYSLPFDDRTQNNDLSGYTAGHLTANKDRPRQINSYHKAQNTIETGQPDTPNTPENYFIKKDNFETFNLTNAFPQVGNDNIWRSLETELQNFVDNPSNLRNDVFVVAGTIGSKEIITSKPRPDGAGGSYTFEINVPEFLWKVVLIPEYPNQNPQDITENAVTFGIVVPNETQTGNWKTAPFSVNEIEELTGYDFFSEIPIDIQDIIEENSTILLDDI